MTKLQTWMTMNGVKDADLASRAKIVSRAQISRIRRGVNGASKNTALRLEALTGIPWHEFIAGAP